MRKIQIPNDNFTDNENKSRKLKAKKINHAPHDTSIYSNWKLVN